MAQVAQWLFDTGSLFFNSIMTDWGIVGLGVIATFLIIRVVNFVKRFLR